jgi:ribosomal protein S18 acetylase RimI-like enzyme
MFGRVRSSSFRGIMPLVYVIRPGRLDDFAFLYAVDREDEGISADFKAAWTEEEWESYRQRIRTYLSASDKVTLIAESFPPRTPLGVICALYRDIDTDEFEPTSVFWKLPRSLFPSNGRFCEIYQLWVSPSCRRAGMAVNLKQALEVECQKHGIELIYTHTEINNIPAISLNHKLGYIEVRRGPTWDEVERVSLVKRLALAPTPQFQGGGHGDLP